MPSFRCDTCGERFNSKHHLELHEEYGDCEPPQSTTTDGQNQEDRTREIALGSEVRGIEGTVCTYDGDGGYGFVTMVDLADSLTGDVRDTQDVFFHISEVESGWIEEGDRIQCTVAEGDQGLECQNIRVIKRAKDKEDPPEPDQKPRSPQFGDTDIDAQYNPGRKPSTSDRDIEDFSDERKFR